MTRIEGDQPEGGERPAVRQLKDIRMKVMRPGFREEPQYSDRRRAQGYMISLGLPPVRNVPRRRVDGIPDDVIRALAGAVKLEPSIPEEPNVTNSNTAQEGQ